MRTAGRRSIVGMCASEGVESGLALKSFWFARGGTSGRCGGGLSGGLIHAELR